jgi:hypothetical protein
VIKQHRRACLVTENSRVRSDLRHHGQDQARHMLLALRREHDTRVRHVVLHQARAAGQGQRARAPLLSPSPLVASVALTTAATLAAGARAAPRARAECLCASLPVRHALVRCCFEARSHRALLLRGTLSSCAAASRHALMVRCVAHMRRRSVYLWVSTMQARFWILRSFVRVMFLLISRAISIIALY